MTTNHSSDAHYRPDIDGLRAVAILPVLLFHAFPKLIPGGFIGVDIFFVISGYLISSIIFRNLASGTWSLLDFYGRRARRILPVLIALLLACLIAGWYTLLPVDYELLSQHVVAGSLFLSNILSMQEAGYFDPSASSKPLLHLWSLGIEEQFYIVWPLLIAGIYRAGWNRFAVIACSCLLSFLLCLTMIGDMRVESFYLPFSRLWELALGALVAHIVNASDQSCVSRTINHLNVRHALSVIGAILIGTGYCIIDPSTPFPGWGSLLPTFGAALIIFAGSDALINRFVLKCQPLVWVGLISYSLYMWHWPLLSFLHLTAPSMAEDPAVLTGIVLTAIVLAILSYRFIERPIRNLQGQHQKMKAAIILLVGLGVTTALGSALWLNAGAPIRFPQIVRSLIKSYEMADMSKYWRNGSCFLLNPGNFPDECVDAEPAHALLIALWGDSHIAALLPGLRKLQPTHNYRLAQFTTGSCPPITHFIDAARTGKYQHDCANTNERALSKLAALKPDVVIIGANWSEYEGQPAWHENISQFTATLSRLHAIGLQRVIVLGVIPDWEGGIQTTLLDAWHKDPMHHVPMRLPFQGPGEDPIIKQSAEANHLMYLSPKDFLCNSDGCLARLGDDVDDLIIWDRGHLTPRGSEAFLALSLARILYK